MQDITVMPFGICIRLKEKFIADPAREALICAAGPAVNLVIAIMVSLTAPHRTETVNYFINCNFVLGAANLLPVLPLDGGRILKACLTEKIGFFYAVRVAEDVSAATIVISGIYTVWACIASHFDLSVVVLAAFFIFNASSQRRTNKYLIMQQVSDYKSKLQSRGAIKCVHIAVLEGTEPKKLLKMISYHAYYVFNFFSKDGRLLKSISETQLILSEANKSL